jgi:hypothetical protein
MRTSPLVSLILVGLLLPALARAQDDDDDPKAAPHAAHLAHHPTATPPKKELAAGVQKRPPARAAEPTKHPADPAKHPVAEKRVAAAASEAHHPAPASHHVRPAPKSVALAELPPPPAASSAETRAVRVRLLDGSTVFGTVYDEQAAALVIDCALGRLAIPRARISTIAYDGAAKSGEKRAPVQQLDDDGPPPRRR